MNSLFQQLNQTRSVNSLPNNVMNMIKTFRNMKNPQVMIQQMLQKNPQVNSLIQAANGNPEKAFRDLAKQMNVDAEQIIQALKE